MPKIRREDIAPERFTSASADHDGQVQAVLVAESSAALFARASVSFCESRDAPGLTIDEARTRFADYLWNAGHIYFPRSFSEYVPVFYRDMFQAPHHWLIAQQTVWQLVLRFHFKRDIELSYADGHTDHGAAFDPGVASAVVTHCVDQLLPLGLLSVSVSGDGAPGDGREARRRDHDFHAMFRAPPTTVSAAAFTHDLERFLRRNLGDALGKVVCHFRAPPDGALLCCEILDQDDARK